MIGNGENQWLVILMLVGGYVLGSVPFGVVVSHCLGIVDPRTAGSRNVGFTNVLRVGGVKAGVLTLLGDMGKGWFMAWLAARIFTEEGLIVSIALMPILGHMFSIFLRFQGGKGVATALGAMVGASPMVGLSMIAVWLITVSIWRYSSGGALAAFSSSPLLAWSFGHSKLFLAFVLLVAGLIWWKHTENVVRLWNGTERRIGSTS